MQARQTPLLCFFGTAMWPRHGQMFSDLNGAGGKLPWAQVGNRRCNRTLTTRRVLTTHKHPALRHRTIERVLAWPDFQCTPLRGCCGHRTPGGCQRLLRRLSPRDTKITSSGVDHDYIVEDLSTVFGRAQWLHGGAAAQVSEGSAAKGIKSL
jgi:hypothetical protein